MKFILYVITYPISGVKYYLKLKRRYAELDKEYEMWKAYLDAPPNVKIKNNQNY